MKLELFGCSVGMLHQQTWLGHVSRRHELPGYDKDTLAAKSLFFTKISALMMGLNFLNVHVFCRTNVL